MRAMRTGLAAASLALVVMAGCTKDKGDDHDTFTRQDVIDELTRSVGLPERQAECIADGLEDEGLPLEKYANAALGRIDPDDAVSAQDQQKLSTVLRTCLGDDAPPGPNG